MNVDGYSSDELKCFHRVLQAAIGEATARRLDIPVSAMIARLFAAADRGERNPVNLKTAILAGAGNVRRASNAPSRPSSITVLSEKHTKRRPVLTLFPRKSLPIKRPPPG
jgi:hypothetical protein